MKTTTLFVCLMLSFSLNIFCQESNEKAPNVLKVTLLNPGVSYEMGVGKFQTIYTQVFMNTYLQGNSDINRRTDKIRVFVGPSITGQYRYYYNYKQREGKGKRTELNSMNYIAPVYELNFSNGGKNAEDRSANWHAHHNLGVVWGLQRNFANRFSLDLNIGPGFYSETYKTTYGFIPNSTEPVTVPYKVTTSGLTLMGQINIGFWLNKRTAD